MLFSASESEPLGRELPRIWVLLDDRPGNATQSLGLADALGWPYETRRLHMRWPSALHNRLLGASIAGIDPVRSDPLEAPWPDGVIAAGRRTAPVALWIRKRSGGRSRLIMLGRKGGDAADLFDLVVTPSYCRMIPHPRRVEITAPLHRLDTQRLAAEAERWRARIGSAPAPRIAVILGGSSGQYRLDATTAQRLGEDVMRMATESGGSVLASTSRRTPRDAADAFQRAAGDAALMHRWSPESPDNPYLALLALADAFVITGDSESMLAEATSLGRPVFVYPLPVRASFRGLGLFREWVSSRARPTSPEPGHTPHRIERVCARLIQSGWVRPSRDLDLLHAALRERGAVRWFGEPFEESSPEPLRERERVAGRVREILGVTPPKGDPLYSAVP